MKKQEQILEGLRMIKEGKTDDKFKKLPTSERKDINEHFALLFKGYMEKIPLADIERVLGKSGIIMIQEDGTEFEGFFTGSEGRANIEIAFVESKYEKDDVEFFVPIENSMLVLTWYKMQSGRWEIVCYLS